MESHILSTDQANNLLEVLKARFERNTQRHLGINWEDVKIKLESNPQKLWTLNEMELSGGEPDVTGIDAQNGRFIFTDCSPESPIGRRSLCYDTDALNSRKENKPTGSAVEMAEKMGVEILNEEQYRHLQTLGEFDQKTSSWLKTPLEIRKHGGAIFGDRRYQHVFIYHNGAESYYAARGFRGFVEV
ncbi:MAG: DUF4256 domain-containing protein [Bacteroidales bacterium]|nr:DUF4256 domain-containing protein [Bacteroidales bacterium]